MFFKGIIHKGYSFFPLNEGLCLIDNKGVVSLLTKLVVKGVVINIATQKHLPTLRLSAVVSNFATQKHLPTLRLSAVVSNFSTQKHLPTLRLSAVVGGHES